MNKPARVNKYAWLVPALTIVAAAFLVWRAPEERTIGAGIKIVYVHVSFTWAGMLGFCLAAVLGAILVVKPNQKIAAWNAVIAWVAWGWFAIGFLLSLWAAKVNWGAIYWQEPRVQAALHFLIISLCLMMVGRWLTSVRLRGALSAFLVFILMWSLLGTPLVMHPRSPIRASGSLAIKLTFLSMFLLSALAATWVAWYARIGRPKSSPEEF